MTKRKDRLKALFAGEPETAPAESAAAPAPVQPQEARHEKKAAPATHAPAPAPKSDSVSERPRSASGAVKAMGLSLGQMAQELKEQSGERVVTLDPSHIEPSPVADRLTVDAHLDTGFAELKASLESRGQQVPVLVRRHSDAAKRADGWYQAAYGHRRIRAAKELGLNVLAIVRDLDDDALILAQGKENAERRDLSFIERAFFARSLIDHGFERSLVQDALGIHKTEMTRLLQVADKVPYPIAKAIGPAPKAGRPRWHQFAEMFDGEAAEVIARDEITSEVFLACDSDQRFQRLFTRLGKRKSKPVQKQTIKSRSGKPIADIKGSTIQLAKTAPDGFTHYLAKQLPDLLAAFEADKNKELPDG